jgi:hypothetical protein
MGDQKPVYNRAGTHVYVTTPANGIQWECPAEVLETYLDEPWNYTLAEPRDDSLDGLTDEAPAPAKKAAAKKAASSTPGD